MKVGDLIRVVILEGLYGLEYYNATRVLNRVGVVVEDEDGTLVNFKSSESWRLCLIEDCTFFPHGAWLSCSVGIQPDTYHHANHTQQAPLDHQGGTG